MNVIIFSNKIVHIYTRHNVSEDVNTFNLTTLLSTGLHLEGPFISKHKNGAHQESLIQEFRDGVQSLENVYGCLDDVSIITLAPELNHAHEIIHHLTQRRIVVSLGNVPNYLL